MKERRIYVIANPAAGKAQPFLKTINQAIQEAGVAWEFLVTKEKGDGYRLASQAVADSVDTVIVYGGDGTVGEVAGALINTGIPLGIIPGGTANVMAIELNIPLDLNRACQLAVQPPQALQTVDMIRIGQNYCITRAGIGTQAAMIQGADRSQKDRLGVVAYLIAGLEALLNEPCVTFQLNLDGQQTEIEGLTCMIANAGFKNLMGLTFSPPVSLDDGLLDVLVICRADIPGLLDLAAGVVGGEFNPQTLQHWQVRQVDVACDSEQVVQADGEIIGSTPISVEVIPQALQVIVPLADRENIDKS